MEEIGFLEIACYAKRMTAVQGMEPWDPFPECEQEEALKLLSRSWAEWKQSEKSIRFYRAAENFGLSEQEIYLVFLAALPCLNRDFEKAYEWLGQNGLGGMELMLDMYHRNHKRRKDGSGKEVRYGYLRHWFLKEGTRDSHPETEDWIAFWLAGYENGLPYEENGILRRLPVCGDGGRLIPGAGYAAEEAVRLARYMEQEAAGREVFYLYGPWGAGKRTCAALSAQKMGKPLFLTDISRWGDGGERTAKEIVRETAFGGGILCVTGYASGYRRSLDETIRISGGILPYMFVTGEKPPADVEADAGWLAIPLGIPDMSVRYRVWKEEAQLYPIDDQVCFQKMANQYQMTPGQIRETMKMAWKTARYLQKDTIGKEELSESCHQFLRARFGRSVKKVVGIFQWEDLVLPKRQKEKLNAACDQILYRHYVLEKWNLQQKMAYGSGISMIFAGPPGTGKTMAAQVMANRLGMELYKVELASVVSKFIGETEKNLDMIFEQACKSQVILFFDEADVLFGKRTEVRDSNDKYSNMEAAFLLQKMEEYPGVVILATNLLQNMDEAFKRRMKFVIDFPFPDSGHRMELWKKSIPLELPVETGLDLQFLAGQFELSGSNIKNVIYQGAFFAASGTGILGMKEILMAIRNEYEKSGKVLSRQEMGPYGVLLE